ncbi:hypothetical protein [Burkholderia orbicola]|uniref:hypothetical protein n=1 Tax=Burkholderia orbicola TaxID=2978683 RepID=UPI003AF999B3
METYQDFKAKMQTLAEQTETARIVEFQAVAEETRAKEKRKFYVFVEVEFSTGSTLRTLTCGTLHNHT